MFGVDVILTVAAFRNTLWTQRYAEIFYTVDDVVFVRKIFSCDPLYVISVVKCCMHYSFEYSVQYLCLLFEVLV